MSKIRVNRVEHGELKSLPQRADLDRIGDNIRARAYELFRRRGFGDGHAVDDWLQAEREICWPAAELRDKGRRFRLRMAMAGFDDDDINVTATPDELIITAHRDSKRKGKDETTVWTEFRSNRVSRRVRMPAEIEVGGIKARYKRGMLTVDAPKAAGRKNKKNKKNKARSTEVDPQKP